jgi:hypothetical protein
MVATEPETYPSPGNGTATPTLPPLRSGVDCNPDGLAYNEDGSLVIIRPLNETQDQVVTCSLNETTSGCSFLMSLTGSTIQVIGDPTQSDLFISIKPSETQTDWFPILVGTSTNYNVTFPISVGNWSLLYNISSLDVTDCTNIDPDVPYDPIPPGTLCHNFYEEMYYKPLDSINKTNIAPISLYAFNNESIINASELSPLACSTTMPDDWSCVAFGNALYLGERIGTMLPNSNIFVPYNQDCISAIGAPLKSACRNNRLYFVDPPSLTLTPFITEGGISPVPCQIVRPSDFDCQANLTAISSNGTLPALPWLHAPNNTGDVNTTVPCIVNEATAMPTCVRIEATYAFGVNATIVVEGVNVRFYIDGVRESLKCIAPALQSETQSSSSSVNMVQNYYGNFGGTPLPSFFFVFSFSGIEGRRKFIHRRHRSRTWAQCQTRYQRKDGGGFPRVLPDSTRCEARCRNKGDS